VVIIVSFWCFI